ncbi:MAG: hypothetical protein M0R32_05860 [Candidatus Cloacimonetes bacterium]|jgi:hypothetical protein|nr:hypothetical protein [Candidatus Cloacimonadota bacterium]
MNWKKYVYKTNDGNWAVVEPSLKGWTLFESEKDAWMWAKKVSDYQWAYEGYDEDSKPEPPKPPSDIEIAKVISRRVLDELAAKLKARNRR